MVRVRLALFSHSLRLVCEKLFVDIVYGSCTALCSHNLWFACGKLFVAIHMVRLRLALYSHSLWLVHNSTDLCSQCSPGAVNRHHG